MNLEVILGDSKVYLSINVLGSNFQESVYQVVDLISDLLLLSLSKRQSMIFLGSQLGLLNRVSSVISILIQWLSCLHRNRKSSFIHSKISIHYIRENWFGFLLVLFHILCSNLYLLFFRHEVGAFYSSEWVVFLILHSRVFIELMNKKKTIFSCDPVWDGPDAWKRSAGNAAAEPACWS